MPAINRREKMMVTGSATLSNCFVKMKELPHNMAEDVNNK